MKKLLKKKGFTLAELLIVVAIIAVLVAISIPVFTAQLNKAKLATDTANVRAEYAEEVADKLMEGDENFVINASDLEAACVNGSVVSVSGHTVTITLGSASNEFNVDEDVTLE